MNKHLTIIIQLLSIVIISGTILSCSSFNSKDRWSKISEPTKSNPEIYGSYTSGCLNGAIPIPDYGNGFYNMNKARNRNFGHPYLINLVENIGNEIKNERGISILIGDISQPRGGPTEQTSSHLSHQIGLEADIWFKHLNNNDSFSKNIYPDSMIDQSGKSINSSTWNDDMVYIMKKFAENNEVERILVNPLIKRELCEKVHNEPWIKKIRPWWGHHQHFHVRIACPENEKYCKKQTPIPNDDDCGKSLDWWFSSEAEKLEKQSTKRKESILPEKCNDVYNWKN